MMMDGIAAKPKDLIRSSFSARVAVLCSSAADSLIKQYNLSFTQLAQPFSRLTCEASWQDPNGQLILVKDLHLTLVDIGEWKKPEVDAQKTRRLLTNVVTQILPPLVPTASGSDFKRVKLDGKSSNYEVMLPNRTLWFETWRKAFLKLQSDVYGSQHEFLNHFVACVLVISSSEVKTSEDVANVVGKLSKVQQQHQYDHPNTWILPSVLKYYLIVQDNNSNEEEAEHVYQNFRTMYGGNFCHLLKLRVEKVVSESEVLVPNPWSYVAEQEAALMDISQIENEEKTPEEIIDIVQSDLLHPLSPDCEKPPSFITQNGELPNGVKTVIQREYGTTLSFHDVRRIQLAFNEFISKALLPYMERQCRNLNDSIMNRRGMSKSFFSATKRLFGTTTKSTPSIVYASESVEILSRKLGDIYFLFGHYGGAYQLFHQLKKDFYGDAAWLYYSSALELAAISHFMMSQSEPPLAVARAFPVHYINDAIGHFIDQCRMTDAATRCAIIGAECLKQLDNHAEAAAIFIRMTSEDCDLRSALMLEQAAYCFIEMNSPRKYALHSVLAGYRYAKAGLKSHSLNCYRQSHQIYRGRGWRCAEDHVNFTIARLQNLLQIPDGVTKHLMSTLVTPSPQPSQQIQIFYKEFLSTIAAIQRNDMNPFEFFIPTIQFSDMRIRIAVTDLEAGECDDSENSEEMSPVTNWENLEEQVVRECIGSSVIAFKPTRLLFTRFLDNTVNPIVPCDEPFYIELPFFNPLKITISLRNITLVFDQEKSVDVSTVSEFELESEASKILRFVVCCHNVGVTTLETVHYELELAGSRMRFQQKVVLKGPRLNSTKAERCGKIYAKDLRNKIRITEKLPLFQATVNGLPDLFFHAQAANFDIVLQEKSKYIPNDMKLSKIIIAAEHMEDTLLVLPKTDTSTLQITSTSKKFTTLQCNENASNLRIPCVFKAPQVGDSTVLDVLVLYEILTNSLPEKKIHRVIRVSIKLPLTPAVHVEYNSLKMLDCVTYLGLLRLYNLTVDYNVFINKIYFTPPDVTVTDLCSVTPTQKEVENPDGEKEIVKMNKNESRNIILKFKDGRKLPKRDVSINVQWEIKTSEKEVLALGNSRMEVQDAITSIESAFVFQVKHPNRVFGDFAASSIQLCNIDLKIHSRTSGKFTIQLENNPPKDDITSTGPSLRASGDIFLSGKTSWTLHLSALETQTVTYSVGVAWPGVYNAAPFIIVTDIDRGVQETYSLHSPIIIAQSKSC